MKHRKAKLAVTLASSALLAGGVVSCSEHSANSRSSASSGVSMSAVQLANLNKAEVKKLLANIEKTKAPVPKMGAMCYQTLLPAARLEYVCPVCGEKTLYTNATAGAWNFELEHCRRLLGEIPGQALTLDESAFCKKCQPAAESPSLKLVVRYETSTNVVSNITSQDLRLLIDFLAGRLLVDSSKADGGITPIKEHLPRLRQLLGLDKEEPSQ